MVHVSDSPISDGPISDGPISDGPISDDPIGHNRSLADTFYFPQSQVSRSIPCMWLPASHIYCAGTELLYEAVILSVRYIGRSQLQYSYK